MPLTVWNVSSGHNFGTFSERSRVDLPLPVTLPVVNSTTFTIISGKLPLGLRLSGSSIIGTPFEVPRTTAYTFVIRASDSTGKSDRTFNLTIEGSDEPKWLTPAGRLPIGSNQAYYIIDSSFIDFQLVASDTDTAAGQKLNFFIASGEGELPPGLRLLSDGRITGFIQPLLAVPVNGDDGFYDTGLYDTVGYDFGYRPTNGYDTYVFDLTTYDFSVDTLKARKLNRNYEFVATITDGDTVTKRKFRIYVVGDDFFRSDNVIMQAGQGTYTADVTYVRSPIFTTPKYLGLRRANNYLTFKIDIFQGFGELGPVLYEFAPANATINGLCEKELSSDNRVGSNKIRISKASNVPEIGYKINFNQEFTGATNETYTVTDVDVLGGDIYRLTISPPLDVTLPSNCPIYLGKESVLPPGMQFDISTGEIFGIVPYQPAVTETYNFTVKAVRYGQGTETNISRRLFTVDILGEVESSINWNSSNNLGTIITGFPSSLFVKATTTYKNSILFYTLEDGKFPPGININLDGEIVGKVNQPRDQNTYKGYWKPETLYNKKDIIKKDKFFEIQSVIRRRNIATLVTEDIHNFKDKDIVKVSSNKLKFNYYSGVEIVIDTLKLISTVGTSQGTGPYRVKFNIPQQKLTPLAPIFTLVQGISASTASFAAVEVPVKSTSGSGIGARFLISKGSNTTSNYVGLIGTTSYPIIIVSPGEGYLPGDTVTISGADLPGGGVDGVNDLTFTLFNGTKFLYKINGNSNFNYNGTFFATASTSSTITLSFDSDPGTFGLGLISQQTGLTTYDAQTQITPVNHFNYSNVGSSLDMLSATGTVTGSPVFYKAVANHTSDLIFSIDNWEKYKFPEPEQSPTTFDKLITNFDNNETTIDRIYKVTIKARDQLGYSAITKEFNLRIEVPDNGYYSNLTARPFLKQTQRTMFKDFINNTDVFDPTLIYRLGDPNFGVQRNLSTLIFAGIETKQAVEYISAMGLNHKPKRFKLGNVKKAVAKEPGTNTVIYETVYLELIDPLEKNKNHLPFKIKTSTSKIKVRADNLNEFYNGPFDSDNPYWKRPIPFNSSVDRTDIIAGDSGTEIKFPSSISIWRKRIKGMESTRRERNYLPLWMRSIQQNTYVELDYIPAVPLCFCKPGMADDIMLNISNSNFDFKLLDYTIDRYIIDAVDGYYEDKYLVFRNDRTTII